MSEREWHYVHERTKEGPISESVLRSRLENGDLPIDVVVWSDGLADWIPANEEPAFQNVEVFPRRNESIAPPSPESPSGIPRTPKRVAKPRPKRAAKAGGAANRKNAQRSSTSQPLPGNQRVSDEDEELIEKCLEVMRQERRASTSLFQRRLRLGYTRAARLLDILEDRGYVAAGEGVRPREILIDFDAGVNPAKASPQVNPAPSAAVAPTGFYLTRGGTNSGPYRQEEIIQMVTTGAISHADLFWREGLTAWAPVSVLFGLTPSPSPLPTRPKSVPATIPATHVPAAPSLPEAVHGIGRRAYWGIFFGITFVAAISDGQGFVMLLSLTGFCFATVHRLKHAGSKPWVWLLIFVPFVNFLVVFACLFAPRNWMRTKP